MAEQLLKVRRHWFSRILHLLLLVPFAVAAYPLVQRHSRIELFLFVLGNLIVLFIILFNNIQPILIANSREIRIFLFYSQNPEIHPMSYLLGYKRKRKCVIFLYSYEHRPVRIFLPAKGRSALINLLKENGIHEFKNET